MSKRSGRGRGLTRREFMAGVAAAAGSMALPGCGSGATGATGVVGASAATLPHPADSGIDHVVVVMMENRSFDHYLGWVPGADGVQAGVTQTDRGGTVRTSRRLAPQFQNCNLADPDHSYAGGRTQINGGKMDGFLLTQPAGDDFPIGYYTADDLPFFKGCAENWTICDRYFCGILSSTTPNRFYMHAGQTDRISNTVDISTLPTIWDRMLSVGRTVAYYYTDVSYTSYWGDQYKSFSKKYDMTSFAADIASGGLPNLMFVDNVGNTVNEVGGLSMDDHPYADIRNGQAFLNQVYDALRQSPQWSRTLLIVNYDEWGGFHDHVPPPLAPVTDQEKAAGNDGRLGCRVPCVLIGPRARRGHVEHLQFDPNSILNLLAWRFGFEPLGARASSNNLALALDFERAPDPSTPAFTVPAGPFGGLCLPTGEINGADNPVPVPVPVPELPTPVGVPLPVPVQLPPLPGLDVPLPPLPVTPATPLLAQSAAMDEVQRRRDDHERELDELRALGARYGF